MSRQTTWVRIGDREYHVAIEPREHMGTTYEMVTIHTQWEVINPSTVWSVHPDHYTRHASIDPWGRLGRKVLKIARAQLAQEAQS